MSNTVEQVIQSPDKDAIGDMTTYCVGCGACTYLDPAFNIAKNIDGCYQASVQGSIENEEAGSSACPFASSINEDGLGAERFSKQAGVHHDQYRGYWRNA